MELSHLAELERRNRELAILQTIIRSTNFRLSLQGILNNALAALVGGLGVRAGAIFLRAGEEMLLGAEEGLPKALQRAMTRLDAEQTHALLQTQLIDVHQTPHALPFFTEAARAGIESWLTVDLHTREVQAGVLLLGSEGSCPFTERDLELVSSIGDYLATAIENAVLVDEMRRSLRRQQALNRASQAINASLELQRVLDAIVMAACELAEADASILLEVERRTDALTPLASSGLSPSFVSHLARVSLQPDSEDPILHGLRLAQPYWLSEWDDDAAGEILAESRRAGFAAFLSLPLLYDEELWGYLGLWWRKPIRAPLDVFTVLTTFAHQALSAISNARLSTFNAVIVTQMDEGILMEDKDGRITFANPRMAKMLGYDSPAELIGQRSLSCIDTRDRFVARLQHDAVLSGEHRRYETTMRTKGGQSIPVLASSTPLSERPGKPGSILTVVTDIREIKSLQDKLVQSEKLAALGELVAGVAHELNNPLTSIIGYSQLLKASPLPASAKEDAERVINQAQRAAAIVRNLLTFARQEPPRRTLVDVNDIVERTLALRSYELRVQNIRVEADLDPNVPATIGDPGQIQQILINLILNAEQAMSKSGIGSHLLIRTQKLEDCVRIMVKDNGPGIPPPILGRIFDPFFTTKEPGEGTGLGLSICYGIVQEHQGHIWAESEGIPGAGACFYVELPAAPARAAAPSEEQRGQRIAAGMPAEAAAHQSILIVDDESDIIEIARRVLTEDGYLVDAATSGEQALRRLASRHYDLVLCDIKMPGLNGIALWKELTAEDASWLDRFIFMTGDMANKHTADFLTSAGAPVLLKPFEIQRLRSWVQERVGKRETGSKEVRESRE